MSFSLRIAIQIIIEFSSELWREWDEMSADCCSILVVPSTNQQHHHLLHDGEVSETSFVLVKKRLKVGDCFNFTFIFSIEGLLGTPSVAPNAQIEPFEE